MENSNIFEINSIRRIVAGVTVLQCLSEDDMTRESLVEQFILFKQEQSICEISFILKHYLIEGLITVMDSQVISYNKSTSKLWIWYSITEKGKRFLSIMEDLMYGIKENDDKD